MRASSASRNSWSKASCSVRAFAKAVSRSLRVTSKVCNLSWASSSLKPANSVSAAANLSWISIIWVRAVVWSRCKSVIRCCKERVVKAASCAAISAERKASRNWSRACVANSHCWWAAVNCVCVLDCVCSAWEKSFLACSACKLLCSICPLNSASSALICVARKVYCSSAWLNCICSTSKPWAVCTASSALSRARSAACKAAW